MLTIEEVQAEAFATATEKGWHKRPLCTEAGIDHDRVLAKLALVHSELTEAQDCLDDRDLVMSIGENDKPEGFVVEIADAVVRLGDLCGALSQSSPDPELFQLRCVDLGGWTLVQVDLATEAARIDNWQMFTLYLRAAVDSMATLCAGVGVDLPGAITAKMAYNKTRSHRHGNKQA